MTKISEATKTAFAIAAAAIMTAFNFNLDGPITLRAVVSFATIFAGVKLVVEGLVLMRDARP